MNDPIAVANNLSGFIFGLIRAIGLILLGFGIVQVGLSLKSHDPSQRAKEHYVIPNSIQQFIPVRRIWPDGIFQVGNKVPSFDAFDAYIK